MHTKKEHQEYWLEKQQMQALENADDATRTRQEERLRREAAQRAENERRRELARQRERERLEQIKQQSYN